MRNSLISSALLTSALCCARILPQDLIAINQLGYRPGDSKIAFMREPMGETFEIRNVETNKAAFIGAIGKSGLTDVNTGDNTFVVDFTPLDAPGLYRIWIPGSTTTSPEFRIAHDVYNEALHKTLESFYYHRCGTEIDNGTIWRHPACHLRKASFYRDPSLTKDVSGGWHDAGDYNRFVATTAVSAAFLLYLYDLQPEKFTDGQISIPEASNGIPDLLDEARWALEWLLKMQRDDGGAFHKVSIKEWTGEHLPHEESDMQYIFEVSSTATGSVAAVAALGSRIFRQWDPPFALQLLRASTRAWDFLESHKTIVPPGGFKNPADVSGGEYGDHNDVDERLWAAVELHRLTGNEKYHDFFKANYESHGGPHFPPGWQNVGNLAVYSYVHSRNATTSVRHTVIERIRSYARGLVDRINTNGYRCVLLREEFYWGSNSVVLGYAVDLIQAYIATGESRFLEAALDQLHYILGRNTFNTSFVTAVGTSSVKRPYHQLSMLLRPGTPVPGMVAGGPNRNSRLRGRTISDYPGKCYEDNEKNYFVNETAINYTAPFVFVAGSLSSRIGGKAGTHHRNEDNATTE